MLLCCGGALLAQDFDLYVQGQIKDADSGEPIEFAQLTVTDELDTNFFATVLATANGDYTRELYTSAVWEGGRYHLEYSADGYATRTAIIDASKVEEGLDMTIAWKIAMDVEMVPVASPEQTAPADLGTCIFDQGRTTFRWIKKEARKAFPIQRYKDQRIVAHAALVDSVSALEGVMLQGRVLSQWNEAALENVQVHIKARGEEIAEQVITTDRYGFYIYSLPYGKVYDLTYSNSDLVSKTMVIDLTGIPASKQEDGFSTILDVRLFQPLENEDLSFLEEPLATMEYSSAENNLVWDMEFSKPKLQRLDAILAKYPSTSSIR